jgi:hypothetical protein
MSAATEPSAPAAARTGVFDTVLTSTPVVLTVISTLLASQSTTEMSFAQYHRSLAAQNQSKASDQWQFFQAKRIRGTAFETSLDLIAAMATPARVDLESLSAATARIVDELKRAEADARRLADELPPAASEEHKKANPASQVAQVAGAEAAGADAARGRMLAGLKGDDGRLRPEAERAFRRLNPPYPRFSKGRIDDKEIQESVQQLRSAKMERTGRRIETTAIENAAIVKVVEALSRRATEVDTRADVEKIDKRLLVEAIRTAEADSDAFDEWTDPIVRTTTALNDAVRALAGHARTLLRRTEAERAALEAAAEATPGLQPRVHGLFRRLDGLGRAADQLVRDFTAARQSFTAWRYGVEARYNQRSAELFEIQVRKSGEEADTHMKRSWGYFYAMLAVQASVTIATLALAVRQKSFLWGLASMATVGGVIYALAVFLNMPVPIPGA